MCKASFSSLDDIMRIVTKFVNFIFSCALNKWKLLNEVNWVYNGLLCKPSNPIKKNVLLRFVECLDEVWLYYTMRKSFENIVNYECPTAFETQLTDLCLHLNELNVKL